MINTVSVTGSKTEIEAILTAFTAAAFTCNPTDNYYPYERIQRFSIYLIDFRIK